MEFNVQGLLNKLTVVNFDSILAQIISWANRPEQDKDGATLRQVVKLILGQAKEDAVFSGTYARLCSRIADRVSPRIQDEFSRNSQRQSITGGMLFRTYLIDQCQEDFEGRWDTHRATLALSRSIKGKTTAITPNFSGEKGLRSDEHDMTRKANRQCVGLVQFMGELFKLQLLTEYAIHECIKKLLSDIVNPEEGDIEGLCKLLATIGQTLDTPNARNRMDGHFERIQKMAKSGHLGFRMQFMLLDMIELRARYWQLRHANPLSILAHPNSSREGSGRRNVARGGSRRGEHRGNSVTESDGWNVTGGAGTSRPVVRAGDLSQFGRISKPTGIQFGPSSVFNRKTTKPNLSPRTKPNETGVRQLP
ncbi:armadillo-type protein [Rhizoctonia solani]|nr:armadillo-type protein [Rhizoctonia solani]